MDNKELILAGVDVQELTDRFLGNTKLMHMIVGKFLQDTTYTKLCTAIAQGDMEQAEFACHSLKGVCGNLSLKKLFESLQEQLKLFRAGEAQKAVAMMPAISRDYEGAVEHLRLWVAQQ